MALYCLLNFLWVKILFYTYFDQSPAVVSHDTTDTSDYFLLNSFSFDVDKSLTFQKIIAFVLPIKIDQYIQVAKLPIATVFTYTHMPRLLKSNHVTK